MSFIFAFSLVQLKLSLSYIKQPKRRAPELRAELDEKELPSICVQLPMYNEKYVVNRLLDSVIKLDYPKEKLRIQILDDSNDETSDLVRDFIEENRRVCFNIEQIQRTKRKGYKSGALEYGLNIITEKFVAIFDADFVPEPSFLKRCILEFEDTNVACVQTRWSHLNEQQNVLTKAQAFALNAHFRIEQVGRQNGGHFINFNGTAGLWRKEAILDAGGWQSDTITEDLDLSYRAQLKGWKIQYLEELKSPAELPMILSAVRSQQYRWNKGAAECARKHLLSILRAPSISLETKVQAFFHLMNSGVFISVFVLTVLSVPLLWLKSNHAELDGILNFAAMFIVSFGILALFFWLPFKKDLEENVSSQKGGFLINRWEFLKRYFSFIAVSMSLSLFNSLAVISGYLGMKSPFVRTPKFNETSVQPQSNTYRVERLSPVVYFEFILFLYFTAAAAYGLVQAEYGLLPMHLLLLSGLAILLKYSWKERA